jgi:hypothetical protein
VVAPCGPWPFPKCPVNPLVLNHWAHYYLSYWIPLWQFANHMFRWPAVKKASARLLYTTKWEAIVFTACGWGCRGLFKILPQYPIWQTAKHNPKFPNSQSPWPSTEPYGQRTIITNSCHCNTTLLHNPLNSKEHVTQMFQFHAPYCMIAASGVVAAGKGTAAHHFHCHSSGSPTLDRHSTTS